MESLAEDRKYTYSEYLTWPEEERWELIEGRPYNMSAAPNRIHQEISMELAFQLRRFLTAGPCRVYHAPFDVRLPEADESDQDVISVVQPDIVVVCDPTKLDDRGCRGAPDLVIEILSPNTAAKDQIQKKTLYEKHGVKEFWVIDPIYQLVWVRLLGEDRRFGSPTIYTSHGLLDVAALPGLKVDLEMVFRLSAAVI